MSKGREGPIRLMARGRFVRPAIYLIALMLIVMAVKAEQLPVAAVRGIVIMIVILVMDRELAQLFTVKFTPAVGADPGE